MIGFAYRSTPSLWQSENRANKGRPTNVQAIKQWDVESYKIWLNFEDPSKVHRRRFAGLSKWAKKPALATRWGIDDDSETEMGERQDEEEKYFNPKDDPDDSDADAYSDADADTAEAFRGQRFFPSIFTGNSIDEYSEDNFITYFDINHHAGGGARTCRRHSNQSGTSVLVHRRQPKPEASSWNQVVVPSLEFLLAVTNNGTSVLLRRRRPRPQYNPSSWNGVVVPSLETLSSTSSDTPRMSSLHLAIVLAPSSLSIRLWVFVYG